MTNAVFRKAMKPHNKEEAERWEEDERSGTLNCFDEGRDLPAHIVVQGGQEETAPCLRSGNNYNNSDPGMEAASLVVQAVPFNVNSAQSCAREDHAFETETSRCLDTNGGFASGQGGTVVVEHSEAYQCHGSNVEPMGTLRAGNGNETGGVPFVAEALAFTERGRQDGAETECQEEMAYCLRNSGDGGRSTDRQVAYRLQSFGQYDDDDTASNLQARDYKGATDLVDHQVRKTAEDTPQARYIVRRLTPRECERLMGFSDDYTLVPYKGRLKKDLISEVVAYLTNTTGRVWTEPEVIQMVADSHRYRALGNAMAVPVVRWIGQRLLRVQGMLERGEDIPGEMP